MLLVRGKKYELYLIQPTNTLVTKTPEFGKALAAFNDHIQVSHSAKYSKTAS